MNTNKPFYYLSKEETLKNLDVSIEKGLTTEEVKKRQEKVGKNEMPKGKKTPAWKRFLLQFHNILIYILIIAGVITALMDHWIDTWVILAVVVVNAIIGFVQEGKAEEALESIKNMLTLHAIVTRNKDKFDIEAVELVPGDIVHLKSGDKVPADIRIVQAKDFQVEESPLTGESTAVKKNTEPVDEDVILAERKCMVYAGTTVVMGSAIGVVVATGKATELGKINQMMTEVEEITTPLLQQIESFGKVLSIVILGVTGLFFAFGYFFRDYSISELFLASIGLIVAAIPEGLPAIMTITLALGVRQMANRNAIIRKLPSVETLGAVNIICSDKTGTLTRNEMTAKSLVTSKKTYEIEGSGYEPIGNILFEEKAVETEKEETLNWALKSIKACNEASIHKEDGDWTITGSPTEAALLSLSLKGGKKEFKPKQIDKIPFESEHKFTASLSEVDGQKYIFLTGAPEKVMERCNHQSVWKSKTAIAPDFWDEQMKQVAQKGERVLATAYQKVDGSMDSISIEGLGEEFSFLALVGIIDPPRPEVIKAVQECKEAGVTVKMITGDHAETAKAIAKQIGISDGSKVAEGHDIEKMSDEELAEIVLEYDVYARTTPEHKLRLVNAIQSHGKLCAMTGDGVNDAPALKKANIGIAMGIKGTEVTKDASEMVLADDNFSSIVHAIEEGRTVYDNIRKALYFILPTNGAESLVIMAAILFGMTMPITPAQILWVNMVTAVTLALAISFEPMEDAVMKRNPRKSTESILGKDFLWRIIYVSVLIGAASLAMFLYMKDSGMSEEGARTMAVNTLVCGQIFYLLNCRKLASSVIGKGFFSNPYVFYAISLLTILQIGFVYLPFMNNFFETEAISLWYWIPPFLVGFIIFWIVELEKKLTLKKDN